MNRESRIRLRTRRRAQWDQEVSIRISKSCGHAMTSTCSRLPPRKGEGQLGFRRNTCRTLFGLIFNEAFKKESAADRCIYDMVRQNISINSTYNLTLRQFQIVFVKSRVCGSPVFAASSLDELNALMGFEMGVPPTVAIKFHRAHEELQIQKTWRI